MHDSPLLYVKRKKCTLGICNEPMSDVAMFTCYADTALSHLAAIIPELKQLLEENFIEEEGGKWRLPNIQDDKDVNALRTGFKQCYIDEDFQTIVTVGNKIPQNLLTEDEILLQFYDIAQNKL